jgi:formylglycine-generating enzyme
MSGRVKVLAMLAATITACGGQTTDRGERVDIRDAEVRNDGGYQGGGGAGGACAGSGGPTMVRVPAPGGSSHCMDSTEVTNEQYAQFMTAKGSDLRGQDAWCALNATFTPSAGWPAAGKENYPVVHVDWCDAVAFCRWAGKRLCGGLGGGTFSYADYTSRTSEWYNACSVGGTQTYPYGNTYNASACNGFDAYAGAPWQAGSKATCEGGYKGLFDLSGNVWEWEDSCSATIGMTDMCRIRGGGFDRSPPYLSCRDGEVSARGIGNDRIGFRCCAE